jgi:phage major head subunit gpT-like protein
MNFTPQTLLDLQHGFSALFEKGYTADMIPVLWDQKAERVDTPGIEVNLYGWLAEMPQFRKWVGARIAKRLAARNYQLKNEPYEFSYSIGRDDIKYDRFGIYNPHATRAGIAARVIWDQILTTVQNAGKTTKCYDGQNFYDTAHPQNLDDPSSATFANLFTTRDLTPANVAYVYGQMSSIKDANGEPMLAVPNVLEYGPDLRDKAVAALTAEFTALAIKNVGAVGGSLGPDVVAATSPSNTVRGLLTPMLNERIPAGVWYMHHTKIMKPFIVQVETAPTGLEMRVNPEDPHVWDNNEFLFGSRAYGAAGVGLPQLSARCEV